MSFYLLDIAAVIATLTCLHLWRTRRTNSFPLPPGPKGLPIIGNVFDMPEKDEWETARQWGDKYGDLVFVQNFGTRYLLVNSYEAATDLLEKRSGMYSGRPSTTMINLEGWSQWFTAMMPYGAELRKLRQCLNMFFQRLVTRDYHDVQIWSTHKLLLKFLERPHEYREHIRHSAAETIIKIAYGYGIAENDPYVALVDRGIEALTNAQTFFLVNALPALRHLPTWLPLASFHKIAEEGYRLSMAMYHDPFNKAKTMIASGTANPSITSKLLESNTDDNGNLQNEAMIAKVVGVTYGGVPTSLVKREQFIKASLTRRQAGGDTTVSALLTFILAMVLYPDAMRKGQKELDSVIEGGNLPTFEDRARLPYVEAICKECLRWQTVTPLGVAHYSEEDDTYNGYFIPAGTTILANAWAMLKDPKRYPEPDKFIPDRWLQSFEREPPLEANKTAFGFGRRICPGRFFAENSIFIGVASILAVFDIQKAVDEHGVPITPSEDYTSNFLRHPKPFPCRITPRSEEAVTLIRQAVCLEN